MATTEGGALGSGGDRMATLAVIGLDARHHRMLKDLGNDHGYDVRRLLSYRRVRKARRYDLDELLDAARRELGNDTVDGITTYWDFPSSCLAPILAEERGLPTPGLRATVMFEHKLWSRQLQQEVAPDATPPFAGVDVFDDRVLEHRPLPFPFWLKPVKSASSHLSFHVGSDHDFAEATDQLRRGIGRLGAPFHQALQRCPDVPDDLMARGGCAAIAEGGLDGEQCTLEGYVHDGTVRVHGIFDIHRGADGSTFTDYRYPSRMPERARTRMQDIATTLMEHAGYGDAAFNIEFFHEPGTDRTTILEVNPRISQEHSELMLWVDDTTNLQVMADVALGWAPRLHPGRGPATVAGKFFLRRADDGVVVRVPSEREIADLEERFAPAAIELIVDEGERLSEVPEQEPYSYLYGYLYLGADEEPDLARRAAELEQELDVRFSED